MNIQAATISLSAITVAVLFGSAGHAQIDQLRPGRAIVRAQPGFGR